MPRCFRCGDIAPNGNCPDCGFDNNYRPVPVRVELLPPIQIYTDIHNKVVELTEEEFYEMIWRMWHAG